MILFLFQKPDEHIPQVLTVPEHSNPGISVGTVIPAVDLDEGDNAIVYYCIVGELTQDLDCFERKKTVQFVSF